MKDLLRFSEIIFLVYSSCLLFLLFIFDLFVIIDFSINAYHLRSCASFAMSFVNNVFLSPPCSSSVSEEALKDLFSSSGFTVKAFKFFQ